PDAYIIARTRYLSEMKPLYGLGADEVIPEEFETSIEIFTRVLTKYLIPSNEIEGFIAEIRSDGYEMLRSLTREHPSFSDLKLHIPDIEISSLRVGEQSTVVGRTVAHIGFRSEYGVTLLVVRRDSQVLPNPGGDVQIFAGDVLVVLGQPEKIAGVKSLLYPVSS
ncbi:MAG: potassium transporter KefB, partial [Methanosarcinales archaeon]|nr:potassium transporter KefB [Methanosarcinales archaeon]